jgi:hypothetical protein
VYIDYKSSNHSENRLSFPFRFTRSYSLLTLSHRFSLSLSLSFSPYLFFEVQIYIDVYNIRVWLHITVDEKNTIVPRTHAYIFYTPEKRKGRRNRAVVTVIYYTRVRKIYFGNHCTTSTAVDGTCTYIIIYIYVSECACVCNIIVCTTEKSRYH